jgi:hypothetical protein
MNHKRLWLIAVGSVLAAVLAACAPQVVTQVVNQTQVVTQLVIQTQVVSATGAPANPITPAPTLPATSAPAATAAPTQSSAAGTATRAPAPTASSGATEPTTLPATPIPVTQPATAEPRVVEVEWPPQLRLGDSDIVRLSIIPSDQALTLTTEFVDHSTITQTVGIQHLAGYDLFGVGRLDAAGFDIQAPGDQVQALVAGQTATWRWTLRPLSSGQQRIALSLRLRLVPQTSSANPVRETVLYDWGFTIEVLSFLGLTTRELAMAGVFGLIFGGTLGLPLAAYAVAPRRARGLLEVVRPNPAVSLELPPAVSLSPAEVDLLRALFGRYQRLVIESEFRSGYSGARTFLARPVRPDGRADAYTIAKVGESSAIRREYDNFETYVKDTLPPVTARIQSAPVTTSPALARARPGALPLQPAGAALRYTFIGEPGQSPTSLRQALLADPNPALLEKLFATFGPHWWRQRRPYTFRLGLEYDRLLPTHFVLEPIAGAANARPFDARAAPARAELNMGDIVLLQHVRSHELRPDGRSLSLSAEPLPGQPPLRLRWLSLAAPAGTPARVVATRDSLLREWVAGFDRHGLPDPLPRLAGWLNETVAGTQSTIHGDLNLENALVGPGGIVWLIDFAQTRDGHTLFDFAYLEACLIAQVISPATAADADFLAQLERDDDPLRNAVHAAARQCLFNPDQPREYQLALAVACLGALKFYNLDARQKQRLYLTAAYLSQTL